VILLAVSASLALLSTSRAIAAVGDPYPGFVWQQHGGIVTVSVMTSSSWPALDQVDWGALVSSVDGRPGREIGQVAGRVAPGKTLVVILDGYEGPREVASRLFSWDRFVESFGVFLAAGLLFGLGGVFLIYIAQGGERDGWNGRGAGGDAGAVMAHSLELTELLGAGLLVTSVLVLSGVAEAGVAHSVPFALSLAADILWSGALAAAAPILVLLAEAVSPGFIPEKARAAFRYLPFAAIATWPFGLLMLRTSLGLHAARELFLYVSLGGLILLAATARTLMRRHWLQSAAFTASFVVAIPLLFTLVMFIGVAALPWAVGQSLLLPSGVLIPAGCLIPVTLVYASLAGNWLTGLKVRAASGQVMLERHKGALASTRLLLHDHVLAELKALRGDIAYGESRTADLPGRLLSIEEALRAQLVSLDADRPFNVPDDFPSATDVTSVISQIAPGSNLEVNFDTRTESWPPLIRWLFFCHLVSLIRNARIHGRAANIRIELVQQGGDAVLIVDDDGPGLAAGQPGVTLTATGIGLRAAQRDIEEEGGRLNLTPSPLGGVRIEERLPLRM
jgi:hypothetical protein